MIMIILIARGILVIQLDVNVGSNRVWLSK